MKQLILFCTILCIFSSRNLHAQQWSINVVADQFEGDEIYLAYYLGNAQYIHDTVHRVGDKFVFTGEDTLAHGVYMVVFPPDNQFFQVMIGREQDNIQIKVRMDDVQHPYHIRGSKETELFYKYVDYLKNKRILADSLRGQIDSLTDSATRDRIAIELKTIDMTVKTYQQDILDKYPQSLTALLITANTDVEIPAFEGTEEEIQLQTYRFVKSHYFDRIPMKDKRLVRTPVLHQRLEYYVNKLTPQAPDSINQSLDVILSHFDTSSEAFKIYLVHFLNHYAKSKIVGMDAVYVHLVQQYYAKGYATWTDKEQLDKILKNAQTLEPILIGKTAPNLTMFTRDNTQIRLHEVVSPYTVLFFWDPDCGHCKKSMPDLIQFYNTYKPKGVEIFAVCTRLQDDVPKCWESVDAQGMGQWVNVVDPYLRSRFKQIYDVRTTPQIFVLDKDKKIIMKKISAEQLAEVMDRLMVSGS